MRVSSKVRPLARERQQDARKKRRAERHGARGVLWSESMLRRVKNCGRHAVDLSAGVTIRATGSGSDRIAGLSGVSTCGSVWACPVCSAKILAGRSEEVTAALSEWTARGGVVAMVTLTMRHSQGQRLDRLWDGLSHAWGKVTSGRAWEDAQDRYGAPVERVVTRGARKGQTVVDNRVRWVRVVETTHGPNGWHVHVHAALLLPAGTTSKHVDDLGCAMFQPWKKALQAKGYRAPLARSGGLHAQLWDGQAGVMGDYFTKNEYYSNAEKAALELTNSTTKDANRDAGHRTPFGILADVVDQGLVDDLALWHEWERSSRGRRQMTWSVGTRAELLPEVEELTDEELAEAADLAGKALVVIEGAAFRKVANLGIVPHLLDLAEDDDDGTLVKAYLTAHGIAWRLPPEPD